MGQRKDLDTASGGQEKPVKRSGADVLLRRTGCGLVSPTLAPWLLAGRCGKGPRLEQKAGLGGSPEDGSTT